MPDEVEGPKPEVPKSKPPKTKENQALPLTSQEFVDALDNLFGRARDAGVRPLQVMATSYAKRGIAIVDSLLAGLEGGDKKKKRKKRKTPSPKKDKKQ